MAFTYVPRIRQGSPQEVGQEYDYNLRSIDDGWREQLKEKYGPQFELHLDEIRSRPGDKFRYVRKTNPVEEVVSEEPVKENIVDRVHAILNEGNGRSLRARQQAYVDGEYGNEGFKKLVRQELSSKSDLPQWQQQDPAGNGWEWNVDKLKQVYNMNDGEVQEFMGRKFHPDMHRKLEELGILYRNTPTESEQAYTEPVVQRSVPVSSDVPMEEYLNSEEVTSLPQPQSKAREEKFSNLQLKQPRLNIRDALLLANGDY